MIKQLGAMMMSALAAMTAYADIAFEVKDVEAHQRYPWNGKVDIDFTIDSAVEGSNFTVSVSAEDTVGKTNVVLSAVRYDDKIPLSRLGKIAAGRHRLTWDGDADVPDTLIPSLAFSVSAWAGETAFPDPELYMVVELSGGMSAGQYPVSYLPSVPKGGWTDEYKTTKLVLRKIPGKQFYAGVFEVTQKQWELVMGDKPVAKGISGSAYDDSCDLNRLGDTLPVFASYDHVYSFLQRTSGQFKLPTWDDWFFVRDSNIKPSYQQMLLNQGEAGWTKGNSNGKIHPVGTKHPNAWGIYDMYGNIAELALRTDKGSKYSYTRPHVVGGNYCSSLAKLGSGYYCSGSNFGTGKCIADGRSSESDYHCAYDVYSGVGLRVFYYIP